MRLFFSLKIIANLVFSDVHLNEQVKMLTNMKRKLEKQTTQNNTKILVVVVVVVVALQQGKGRSDLMHGTNTGSKTIDHYFLQGSMREKRHCVNSGWTLIDPQHVFLQHPQNFKNCNLDPVTEKENNTCFIALDFW